MRVGYRRPTWAVGEVAADVKGLHAGVGQHHAHVLLVVGGDECEALRGLALVGASGRGDQRRETVRAGRVLPR